MSRAGDLLHRVLPDVREHERSRFLLFGSLSLLITMAQTLGLVGAETLFLSTFGAERLPPTFIAASAVTVLGSFVYASIVGRFRNDDLFVVMLTATTLVLAGVALGIGLGLVWMIPALICLFYLLQAVFLNHFFTFVVDYFDATSSKRLFPLFTIAASLGGALGGATGVAIARGSGPLWLLVGWSALYAAAALLLRLARRPLRRWGPLDLEEADETSVEGIQGAVRYLRASALGRWLALAALGMVVSLFVAQYLYSDVFARAFPEPEQLASFLGVYLAVTNVVEIGIAFVVTPWLIRSFGVASSNLLHPVLTLFAFAGLASSYGLGSAIGARMNRELVDNAAGFPIRSLVYNAMPVRLRGRMRAFLEGIVVYAGMSAAGLLLLLVRDPDPRWLCAGGASAALVFLAANLMARREYVRALVSQLRTGNLDLSEIGDEIGDREATQLAELWEQMLREEGSRPSRPLLELIPNLARRGILAPLIRETRHPSPDVRRSCVVALAPLPGDEIDALLCRCLVDEDPRVRLAALRGATLRRDLSSELESGVRSRVDDAAPEVRAEAAVHAGARGAAILDGMARSPDPADALAALGVAAPSLLEAARERIADPDPAIRAAALEAVARLAAPPPVDEERVTTALRDDDARVRRAAVLLLANYESDKALTAVASALADPAVEVALTAETLLGSFGDEGAEAAVPHLHSQSERATLGALRVLAATGDTDRLRAALRERARQLWWLMLAYPLLPDEDRLATRFLRAAYRDALQRTRRIAFHVLELIEDPSVIRKVDRSLRMFSTRSRGDALEVLSNLGERDSARLLVLFHEEGSLESKRRSVEKLVPLPESTEQVLDASMRSELRFVRMGARALAAAAPELVPDEETMERLLALRHVPLFSQLSLEQLEAVLRITREVTYSEDEVIFREGDPGGVLYLLIEGSVRVYKSFGEPDEEVLATLDATTYFGEMAILDDEPRSATVMAARQSRVLLLEGASLKDLILQMPRISFEIFRVLTSRLRAAEARRSDR